MDDDPGTGVQEVSSFIKWMTCWKTQELEHRFYGVLGWNEGSWLINMVEVAVVVFRDGLKRTWPLLRRQLCTGLLQEKV